MTLTRDDIRRVFRIHKLLRQAADPGTTAPERDAYILKAARLRELYRNGKAMRGA